MNSPTFSKILARAAAIVIASIAIGLAFDAAHPAPLVMTKTVDQPQAEHQTPPDGDTPSGQEVPDKATPVQQASQDNVYQNQAISAKIVSQDDQPPQTTSENAYTNKTLSVSVISKSRNTLAAPHVQQEPPTATTEPKPESVTWPEAKIYLEDPKVVLIDARNRAVFQAGSIPGAVPLPYNELEKLMPDFSKKYSRDRFLIVYCSDAACATSEKVAKILMTKYGYHNVLHMPGGYEEWRRFAAGKQESQTGEEQ